MASERITQAGGIAYDRLRRVRREDAPEEDPMHELPVLDQGRLVEAEAMPVRLNDRGGAGLPACQPSRVARQQVDEEADRDGREDQARASQEHSANEGC